MRLKNENLRFSNTKIKFIHFCFRLCKQYLPLWIGTSWTPVQPCLTFPKECLFIGIHLHNLQNLLLLFHVLPLCKNQFYLCMNCFTSHLSHKWPSRCTKGNILDDNALKHPDSKHTGRIHRLNILALLVGTI